MRLNSKALIIVHFRPAGVTWWASSWCRNTKPFRVCCFVCFRAVGLTSGLLGSPGGRAAGAGTRSRLCAALLRSPPGSTRSTPGRSPPPQHLAPPRWPPHPTAGIDRTPRSLPRDAPSAARHRPMIARQLPRASHPR
eukprot:3483629-Pyramimonas_sp.AAC.1